MKILSKPKVLMVVVDEWMMEGGVNCET